MISTVMEMNEHFARQILNWEYEEPYDLYSNEFSMEALEELLDNPYFSIIDNRGELIGFFCIGKSAQVPIGTYFGAYEQTHIDIGIGLKPELTGKGLGSSFFSFILSYIEEMSGRISLRLTVAKFNSRAIHLYEKLGFTKKMEFNIEDFEFMTMVKEPR